MSMPQSFMQRRGTYRFTEPTTKWGYLPMLNQWAQKEGITINWKTQQISSQPPVFNVTPIFGSELLTSFCGASSTKRGAKEVSAGLIVRSGLC
ncbi:hypothetical protein BOTBODRAFT_66067 [Botryobasidium botryosum FD-172 SS1]|uniref:DRBM domain-containing protein n=1 Tax=Botryobasidium botryosum (strain FD-172 SS1) TaxID=930990 RepID=A0A067MRH6_BOTB1|nr:hypothetical protein BOTBODRAFT_66067 [Botryobasidium botryosum FD-172 SS1]